MNKIRFSILVIFLGIASSTWAKGGYIYEYAGDVKVAVAGGAPREATDSLPLEDNTTVTTGNASRAVLKFEDGQVVVLKPNSSFLIKKYNFDLSREESSNISFSLLTGGLRAITGLIGARNKQAFHLTTPTASCGIRGTDFMLQTDGESMDGQVKSGAITLQTGNVNSGLIRAGQSTHIASKNSEPDHVPSSSVEPTKFLQLQVIAVPTATSAPVPAPGTKTPAPTAKDLSEIAKDIHVVGLKSADMATAMIQVGNKPAVVVSGVISFDPRAAASITTAAIKASPDQAVEITTAAVTVAPSRAGSITTAAVKADPTKAVDITTAAVTAAPNRAAAITTAAVTASPTQAVDITTAAVKADPSRAAAITSAAIMVVPAQASEIVNAVGTTLPSQSGPAPYAPEPQAQPQAQPQSQLPMALPLPPATPPSSGGGGAISPN